MGDFFTSPRERAGTTLYDMAMGGTTPYDRLIRQGAQLAKSGVERQTGQAIQRRTSDILSQAESAGVTFSSGLQDVIGKETSRLLGAGTEAGAQVDLDALAKRMSGISELLRLGYSGLSTSSTFGDILAGLTTVGNLGAGVALGLGPHGLGLFGVKEPTNT